MAEQITVNQVETMLVDIVLDEAPDTAIMAQEEFATLSELLPTVAQARPDIAPKLVSLMIRASSLPDKRELMRILDEPTVDPAAAQAQQQAQQLGIAAQEAGISVAQTQAQLNAAKAASEQAKTQAIGPQLAIDAAAAQAEGHRDEALSLKHAADAGIASVRG
jgi:hypothetical protein